MGILVILVLIFSVPVLWLDRYEVIGPDLLLGQGGELPWQVEEKVDARIQLQHGVWRLQTSSMRGEAIVRKSLTSFGGEVIVRLQGTVACRDVVAGKKSWHKGRLYLLQYKKGKAQWNKPHEVISLEGTRDWKQYTKELAIAPDTDEIRVAAQLSKSSGTLLVKDVSLHRVQQRLWYSWLQKLAWLVWPGFIFLLILPYVRRSTNMAVAVLLLSAVLAIFIGVTVPGATKGRWKKSIEQTVHIIPGVTAQDGGTRNKETHTQKSQDKEPLLDIAKVGHFLFFLVLGNLMVVVSPGRPVSALLPDIVLVACATEMLQLFIDGRSPLFTDVCIDTAGGFIGMLLVHEFAKQKKKRDGTGC